MFCCGCFVGLFWLGFFVLVWFFPVFDLGCFVFWVFLGTENFKFSIAMAPSGGILKCSASQSSKIADSSFDRWYLRLLFYIIVTLKIGKKYNHIS